MGGVILEHVNHIVQWDEGVIDGDNLSALGNGRAEDKTANTAESVNANLEGKMAFQLFK